MSKTGWDMTDEELGRIMYDAVYHGENSCDLGRRARALFPRPEPRQDVPSVEEIAKIMLDNGIARNYTAAKVAHAMMQKLAVRPKMMVEGMTLDQLCESFSVIYAGNNEFRTPQHDHACAIIAHRLANTPAEPAPDPDASAKALAFKWHQSTKHGPRFSRADLYWSYIGNRMGAQDAWRAVAAKDKP